jgi:hypothetical protein
MLQDHFFTNGNPNIYDVYLILMVLQLYDNHLK